MTTAELLAKYDLSEVGLEKVFQKMVNAGILDEKQLRAWSLAPNGNHPPTDGNLGASEPEATESHPRRRRCFDALLAISLSRNRSTSAPDAE